MDDSKKQMSVSVVMSTITLSCDKRQCDGLLPLFYFAAINRETLA